MARILLVYGTREGHTADIARRIATTLEDEGHHVALSNLRHDAPSMQKCDAVLVGASVHIHAFEREVRRWVRTHCDELSSKPNAFFSVCLSSANHDAQSNAEVDAVIDNFVEHTGWKPALIGRFAGAVAYSQYNWLTKQVMRRIARHETDGGCQDTSRDYDLTDYDEVTAFARAFADMLSVAPTGR